MWDTKKAHFDTFFVITSSGKTNINILGEIMIKVGDQNGNMNSYNYLCFITLVKKEIFRFLKVGIQTIIGPAISSLLFLAVFSLALGRSIETINVTDMWQLYCVQDDDDDDGDHGDDKGVCVTDLWRI